MKSQCMNKDVLKYEIGNWADGLKKSECLIIIITRCPILNKTYDLNILKQKIKEK